MAGYRWGMAVDLDKCTGCEACVAACHAENNIPTVGAQQAARGRAMHWIRVERYYEGNFPDVKVKFRPVLCQQCDNGWGTCLEQHRCQVEDDFQALHARTIAAVETGAQDRPHKDVVIESVTVERREG